MATKRYSFQYSPQVSEALKSASPAVLLSFYTLLEGIGEYPFPGASLLGVLEYKEKDLPGGGYTATFDNGLLLFQVMADYPIIKLIQITWL